MILTHRIEAKIRRLFMNLDTLKQAYQTEYFIGSYCTAPLRQYNSWFQGKIDASEDNLHKTLWKVAYVVGTIFAGLPLGFLALVGIAVNLFFIPPEDGYSLWARLNGTSQATERFCSKMRSELQDACRQIAVNPQAKDSQLFAETGSSRNYSYSQHQQISFDVRDVFGEALLPEESPIALETNEERILPEKQSERSNLQEQLRRMNIHLQIIESAVTSLSQKYGWYPEKYCLKTALNQSFVLIPIPDHIPLPRSV
jgi:hypothetical protein